MSTTRKSRETSQIILKAMFNIMSENEGYIPTDSEIAEKCGLSVGLVAKNKKLFNVRDFAPDFKLLTPKVIMGIASNAMSGNAQSQKLWLEYVEGWNPATEITGKDGKNLEVIVTRKIIDTLDKK